ncbi:PglL family O-oligosaccharyltransferase [Roseateles violae]|uniref:Wzy polymerase domain-containing protein n=1 Tax=Roseateles violae TaxID=3058042 RepID=A0ABT8DPD5_9BURK|nr:O-antigen ligase family protein [Pelomonas sp. PFR6]MDN3918928.1 Wzy polymerase domain-containing protein [Pelomonas sp. PFR6]
MAAFVISGQNMTSAIRWSLQGKLLQLALCLAVCVPCLLIFNLLPSSTLFNQVVAAALWGLVLVFVPSWPVQQLARDNWPPVLLCICMGAGAVVSAWISRVPLDHALGTAAMMAATLAVLLGGASIRSFGMTELALDGLTIGLYLAASLNLVVALIQMFAPQWADGVWLAQSALHGRGIGNLRQPNLMALLLLWAMISVLWWEGSGRLRPVTALLLTAPLVLGVAVTASRAGVLGVLALSAWAWLRGRGRAPGLQANGLRYAPVLLLLSWGVLYQLSSLSHTDFATASRAAEGVASPGRVAILRDAWALIQTHPWFGVGWGGLNFAWALTPNPQRANYNFDHTHNLIVQWAVELGLPLAILLTGLLLATLWRLLRPLWIESAEPSAARVCCVAAVVLIVGHNQLEFPFWYAYFLLPTVFCIGLANPTGSVQQAAVLPKRSSPLRATGLLLMLGAALIVFDFMRVAAIFSIYYEDDPIKERLEAGRRSWLFSWSANYADATMKRPSDQTLRSAPLAAHGMADPRLLIKWSQAFHADGQENKARYLAARAREFRRKEDAEFFAPCQGPAPLPYQCQPASGDLSYQDFKP